MCLLNKNHMAPNTHQQCTKQEMLDKFEREESIANGGTGKFRKRNTHLTPKKKKRR